MTRTDPNEGVQPARRTQRLAELLANVTGAAAPLDARLATLEIHGITDRSADVRSGTLFIAVPGRSADGHRFVSDAIARGAAAVVAERELEDVTEVPVLRVADARRALAEIAAAWHGRPAERLDLIGITGTVGKTSVLSMIDAILTRAGRPIGTIGSFGVGFGGRVDPTGYTAPDAPIVHEALARIAAAGLRAAALEVTSHALMQRRVEGLRFRLGVFTNLVPFEHSEYHRSFRSYVDAKSKFFEHMEPLAPLLYNADDRTVRAIVRGRDVQALGCGHARSACVRIELTRLDARGTSFVLNVRRALPRLDGGEVAAARLPFELRLLGRSNVLNATLAAAAALCLGADADSARAALREASPPRRRMELIRLGDRLVLDDTAGHPDSLSAVFEVVERLAPKRVHLVFGVRGMRGRRINTRLAETLAIWARLLPLGRVVITSCEDAADERNRVQPEERAAFLETLRRQGMMYAERSACRDAVELAIDGSAAGELVLLLGAQGMDRAAAFARQALSPARRGAPERR
jgi:UDP-N-acetylmuramoyl-L-alanyl-D-glutamate--2,6-diaminopimelate ligase